MYCNHAHCFPDFRTIPERLLSLFLLLYRSLYIIMSPFHYVFDKCYPIIRFVHEKVKNNVWFTEIMPQLWLGGAPTYERDYQFLLDNGINAVVNIRAEREDDQQFYAKHDITYIQVKVFDMLVPQNEHFDAGVKFTHEQIEAGRTVLIHCAKGRGRSAVLMAAYLMKHHKMKFEQAVKTMKDKRSLVKQEPHHKVAAEKWIATQE